MTSAAGSVGQPCCHPWTGQAKYQRQGILYEAKQGFSTFSSAQIVGIVNRPTKNWAESIEGFTLLGSRDWDGAQEIPLNPRWKSAGSTRPFCRAPRVIPPSCAVQRQGFGQALRTLLQ